MKNKKAVIHWDILLIAFLVSIGIIFFSGTLTSNVPKVGQYSISMTQAFEKNSNIPLIAATLMKQISRNSISNISSDVFQLSNCKNYINYKLLNSENEICFNKNLEGDFKAIFDKKYIEFQSKKLKDFDLDFSNTKYDFSINKENEKFFLNGKTENRFEIPINLIEDKGKTGKQIGKMFIKPSFNIPIGFNFDEYENLAESIKDTINDCEGEDNPDKGKCVSDNLNKDGFELQECETGEEKEFYGFLEYFDNCANSIGISCVCPNRPQEGTFSINQVNDGIEINGRKIEIENANLARDLKIKPGQFLYKDAYGEISVTNKEEGDICTIRAKTKFRFCVKSNKNQYYAYDEDAQKIVFKDLVYKFALQFSK